MTNQLLYFVKEVGTPDRTKDMHLPDAIKALKRRVPDGDLWLSWDKNEWQDPAPAKDVFARIAKRLDGAQPGIDAFVTDDVSDPDGFPAVMWRIKTIEDIPEAPTWSGASPDLAKLLDAVWAEFPGEWQNWGIHVCRKIAGSSSWSQHSWDDAVDIGVGSDKAAGDDINRWLAANEKRFGGYCERLWWLSNSGDATTEHRDHIHISLAPCHTGTPPCA
jgi:hypothetical protein